MYKPVFKISASLLNSWIYYIKDKTPKNRASFVESLKGEFKGNKWTERGQKYEAEVFAGKHGDMSKLVKDIPHQHWLDKKIIKVGKVYIMISGKADAIDHQRRRIYDIKRTVNYKPGKYDDSMQHPLYFFLDKDTDDFYYLTAADTNNGIEIFIDHMKRPNDKELEKYIMDKLREFFVFLHEEGLLDTYLECQKAKKTIKE